MNCPICGNKLSKRGEGLTCSKFNHGGDLDHFYYFRTNPAIEIIERFCADYFDQNEYMHFKLKNFSKDPDIISDTECMLFEEWVHIKDIKAYNLIKNGIIGKDFPLLKKLLMLK